VSCIVGCSESNLKIWRPDHDIFALVLGRGIALTTAFLLLLTETSIVELVLCSNNCHELLINNIFSLSLFQRIPFLFAITLTLTQVTAGFPQPIDVSDPSEEEHMFPPLESANGTLK